MMKNNVKDHFCILLVQRKRYKKKTALTLTWMLHTLVCSTFSHMLERTQFFLMIERTQFYLILPPPSKGITPDNFKCGNDWFQFLHVSISKVKSILY